MEGWKDGRMMEGWKDGRKEGRKEGRRKRKEDVIQLMLGAAA